MLLRKQMEEFHPQLCRSAWDMPIWKTHLADNTSLLFAIKYLLEVVVLVIQLCPTVWSPPGSSIHGILQAGILEWFAISFSRGSSWPRNWTWVSNTAGRLFTLWATREALSWRYWFSLSPVKSPSQLFCESQSWVVGQTGQENQRRDNKKFW